MISLSILNYLRYWNGLPASGNLVLLSIPHDWELWLYSSTGRRNSQIVITEGSGGGRGLRHLLFKSVHPYKKRKRTPIGVHFDIGIHVRYSTPEQILARFVAVLPSAECKVSNPSSRIRAIVHRTIAFHGSNLSKCTKIKTTCRSRSFLFWRYWPDLNWRITVLQTGALPLGYSTIWKSGTRGYVPDLWSGRRGSNSLPPPWQGGALPDELRPQIWCLRSESNQRHADFQSAALPTELQRHMRK